MGKRRRPALQYTSSDDDDNAAPKAPKPAAADSSRRHHRGRNPGRPAEEEGSDGEFEEKAETDEEEDDEDGSDAVPLGEPLEVLREGKQYAAYEYEGNTYKLEDTAMFSPGEKDEKPYVGIIKEINEINGSLLVTAQWFYRPEEAQKEGGGGDPRELLYSFHLDDVAAESVMHTCVVHFIPQHKQVPSKKEHPGFIVQQVYDHKEERFHKLTDTDYDDANQQEIDHLVMKTMGRIGELLDRYPKDIPGDKSDYLPREGLKKRPLKPKDVPRDAPAGRSEQLIKGDTAGNDNLKNHAILSRYKAVPTGNQYRDKWLDKYVGTILALPHSPNDDENSYAPNVVVSIVASIERSTYEALYPDFHKYNQKMRTLLFNIKNSSVLRKRLMNKELDPPVLLTMTPDELKAGLAPAEIGFEFEEPRQLQMTEARCKRCTEKNVGIREIMHGNRGDRYQVECISCGFEWSASRDEVV